MRMGGRADTPRKRGAGLEERADPCERTVSPLALEHTSPFHWIFDPILFRLTLVRLSEASFSIKWAIEASKHASSFLPNFGMLENMLQDPSAIPMYLPMEFLKAITSDFSEALELGRGGYGVVYKVRVTSCSYSVPSFPMLANDQFHNEVTYLIGCKHQNVVELVGYCTESRWEATLVNESRGLEWHMRYEIIKGVCRGLHHLHAECHIVHLDLKPENILLDDNMKPKIADFGMSRLFGEQQSRIITGSRGGTFGYMAPEYLTNGLISTKSDIFSLGVMIIELMTGHRDYPQSSGTPSDHFIEKVLGNWRHRLEKTSRYSLLEIYCQQVKNCIMAGVNGVDPDPKRRPSAWDIIQTLNETEGQDSCFGKNEGTAMGQKSQTGTSSGSFSTNSNNSVTDFDRILSTTNKSRTRNISAMFRFAPKGAMISILSFEIANTIVKAYNLMKLLSKQEMRHLKEGVLRSEGVHHLISEDYSQLLLLVENDIREEFRRISVEVCRFGNLCIDHRWHRLDRYLSRLEYEVAPQKNFEELALSNMKCLINYVQATLILRQELQTLDRVEQEFYEGTLSAKSQVAKKQRAHVKNWKKKSLWSKKMEDVVEKLVDIVHFMHLEINSAFLKNHGVQSVKEERNLGQTLGSSGLSLHYANVILQIKTLVLASPAVPDKARDSLYQALPPRIKSVLGIHLRQHRPSKEKRATVEEVRAEIDRVLQWLVPAAESTRLYHLNGASGEWAMKGIEDVDIDEVDWFQQDSQINVSSMLNAGTKVSKIETLYHADKERTEAYILYLVKALQSLVPAKLLKQR
ncbi:hypothetical protein ACQ4PT_062435 [Festuca glaucescens]